MTKIAGSGSGSIISHGSADPDPHQNVMDDGSGTLYLMRPSPFLTAVGSVGGTSMGCRAENRIQAWRTYSKPAHYHAAPRCRRNFEITLFSPHVKEPFERHLRDLVLWEDGLREGGAEGGAAGAGGGGQAAGQAGRGGRGRRSSPDAPGQIANNRPGRRRQGAVI